MTDSSKLAAAPAGGTAATSVAGGRARTLRGGRCLATLAALCLLPLAAGEAAAGGDTRNHCDVAFTVGALPDETALGLIDFTVQYARPKIFPPDSQGKLVCSPLVHGAAVAVTNKLDNSSSGTLTLAFASGDGAPAMSALLRCEVYSAGSSVPVAADFPVITTLQARSTTGAPIDPLPVISVGQVRCGDSVTTTTTSTTTTTQPPASTTTTTLPPQACFFGLVLQSAGDFRRVRFEVDYSGAGGSLEDPARSACRSVAGASVGVGIDPAPGTLTLDVVGVAALHGPAELVRCDFVPTGFIADATDFDVTVLAAADAAGAPAPQLPTVAATAVSCPAVTTTTTTVIPPTSTSLTTTTTADPDPLCGDANLNGVVQAGDALAALRRAVGLSVICPLSRCDVDSSGAVTTSDALLILLKAVGSPVILDCP